MSNINNSNKNHDYAKMNVIVPIIVRFSLFLLFTLKKDLFSITTSQRYFRKNKVVVLNQPAKTSSLQYFSNSFVNEFVDLICTAYVGSLFRSLTILFEKAEVFFGIILEHTRFRCYYKNHIASSSSMMTIPVGVICRHRMSTSFSCGIHLVSIVTY